MPLRHTPTEKERHRHRLPMALYGRFWIVAVYGVLFALSVPWYLPKGEITHVLWFGVPYWVVLSLLALFAIACFTAWVVHRFWLIDEDGGAR